jgi:hypothetical protein
MAIGYTWEKPFGAVYYAVASNDSLPKRVDLLSLGLLTLEPRDFAEGEMREKWVRLVASVTGSRVPGDERMIVVDTSNMTEEDASQVAARNCRSVFRCRPGARRKLA